MANRSTNREMFDLADWANRAEKEIMAAVEGVVKAGITGAEVALSGLLSHLRAARDNGDLPTLKAMKAHWENPET
jgi:hypothetical protein